MDELYDIRARLGNFKALKWSNCAKNIAVQNVPYLQRLQEVSLVTSNFDSIILKHSFSFVINYITTCN